MPSTPAKRKQQYIRKKKQQEKEKELRAKVTQRQLERESRMERKLLPVPYETKGHLVHFSDEQWAFCKKQKYGAARFLRTIVDQYRSGEFPSSGGLYWYMENEILPRLKQIESGKEIAEDMETFLRSWKKSNSQWGLRHEF